MSYQQVSIPNRNGQLTNNVPDPEVRPKAQHRRFTAEYKALILSEADACHIPGQIGALLRREGLYASHLTAWRRQRTRGTLAGLTPKARGPKTNPLAADNAAQSREIVRLQAKLQRAETIIAVQKKLCTLLGLPSEPDEQP
jgi:transposase-like protein